MGSTSSSRTRHRIGGITQFLRLAALAEHAHLQLAPHFAMEIHLHLAAAYPHEAWVEHFDWLYLTPPAGPEEQRHG